MPLNGTDFAALADDLDWDAIRVASFVPGRVRLRSDQLRADQALGSRIADALSEVEAITDVSVNVRTGSVLVRYDEDDLEDLPALIDRAGAFGMLPEGVTPEELKDRMDTRADGSASPDVSGEVRSVFSAMDASVKEATGGAIDLKGLVPLSLVGMGTYRVLSGAATQSLPWFNYFWFAFSVFVAMEAGADDDATSTPADGDAAPATTTDGTASAAAA